MVQNGSVRQPNCYLMPQEFQRVTISFLTTDGTEEANE